jgi:hypothetical protein
LHLPTPKYNTREEPNKENIEPTPKYDTKKESVEPTPEYDTTSRMLERRRIIPPIRKFADEISTLEDFEKITGSSDESPLVPLLKEESEKKE